jgi:DNA-binding FadR family transcriptional regulator
MINMPAKYLNPFLKYLSNHKDEAGCRLPSLSELSKTTETSIPSLREQLEVARAFGFVEVRPKTGIRKNKYRFTPAVAASITYALEEKPELFDSYADLRKHIEEAYFEEAASLLTSEDIDGLGQLVDLAKIKLAHSPAEIPFIEHRELHLLMYSRLENPFVTGLLEAYWQIYEDVGLSRFTDLDYHKKVWNYHEKIVDSIRQGEFSNSRKTLLEHMILIQQRPKITQSKNHFE